jgi:hypothetical protein
MSMSKIPLEVVRIVDDRIGLIFEGGRVVGPGESGCNTDFGDVVRYVVKPDDAGRVIRNNAVVTVQTQEAEPRVFQLPGPAHHLGCAVLRFLGLMLRFPARRSPRDHGNPGCRRQTPTPPPTTRGRVLADKISCKISIRSVQRNAQRNRNEASRRGTQPLRNAPFPTVRHCPQSTSGPSPTAAGSPEHAGRNPRRPRWTRHGSR